MFHYDLLSYAYVKQRDAAALERLFSDAQIERLERVYEPLRKLYPIESEFFRYIHARLGEELNKGLDPFARIELIAEDEDVKDASICSLVRPLSPASPVLNGSARTEPITMASPQPSPVNAFTSPRVPKTEVLVYDSRESSHSGSIGPFICSPSSLSVAAVLDTSVQSEVPSEIESKFGDEESDDLNDCELWKCTECDMTVRGRRNRRDHIGSHHKKTSCKCPFAGCPYVGPTPKYVRMHVSRVHQVTSMTHRERKILAVIFKRFGEFTDRFLPRFFPPTSLISTSRSNSLLHIVNTP
ncbi:hypothetical protein L596_028329 [Steinernema carpocapsae]|uniref:C2H2-type domain-containing protein n=1 Tax=Steinernema carpocapsae TaxID=34508 RepID=A0A4U5LY34_STECR|nr:hypothetical protein L596_028329 [Steinernema carpocapsae]